MLMDRETAERKGWFGIRLWSWHLSLIHILGTGVVKLPGLNCGRTGLTEAAAREAGFDVETVVAVTDDKAPYSPCLLYTS